MARLAMLGVLMLVMNTLVKIKNLVIGDTHLRLEGDSVNALELRFILDWNSQSTRDNIRYEDRYFLM